MAKDGCDKSEKRVAEVPCENLITMDSRYECPICLNYLEDAVLTSCGHRFCFKCITSWLEQNGSFCPLDTSPITHKDIFPDNLARREIIEARLNNLSKGPAAEHKSPNVESNRESSIKEKVHSFGKELKVENYGVHDPMVAALYERIILLEQRAHEQDIVMENLRRKVTMLEMRERPLRAALEEEVALRCCNGLFVWKIKGLSSQLGLTQASMLASQTVSSTPPQMIYSPSFYTLPTCGYKFCTRLNLSPRNPSQLSLVVHVVRGEFDDILPWPFTGRITLELVNQRDFPKGEHLKETVCVGGEGSPRAFSRPPADGPRTINPRGFGYMEFVALADLQPMGFLVDDSLIIKVLVEHSLSKSL